MNYAIAAKWYLPWIKQDLIINQTGIYDGSGYANYE